MDMIRARPKDRAGYPVHIIEIKMTDKGDLIVIFIKNGSINTLSIDLFNASFEIVI